jgi:imidazolonepropionase-like amidohydrolase
MQLVDYPTVLNDFKTIFVKSSGMKKRIIFLLTSLVSCSGIYAQVYELKDGFWWQKGRFVKKTIYAVNGIFSFKKIARPDSVIDLTGQYCIPPFGDAHTHNLDGARGLREMIEKYLKEGIYYVQVLGNHGEGSRQARPILKQLNQLEATYANGLLTSTYGHGFYPYEPFALGIYIPYLQFRYADSVKKSRLVENNAYYFLDASKDVDEKWPLITKYKPDHIKIVLMDAADYSRKRKVEKVDDNGLSPEVAAYVVKKAHAAGLRVFAHVETAADARLCAKIGVDALAHLPGYGWDGTDETKEKMCINENDVLLLKNAGITVIPTLNIDGTKKYDSAGNTTIHPALYEKALSYQKKILSLMIKNGVPIALGADYYGNTVKPEIDKIIQYQLMTPGQLIHAWSTVTPQSIFPNRKLGLIAEGYEASFLVLNENPLKNSEALHSINFGMKQGKIIK